MAGRTQRIVVTAEIEDEHGRVLATSSIQGRYELGNNYDPSATIIMATDLIEAQAERNTDPLLVKVAELARVVNALDEATARLELAVAQFRAGGAA